MLNISQITYRIGARTILDDCSATIMDQWRVGVVGANGAGKSTLFKIIAGDIAPDGGTVTINQSKRMAMVRQDIPDTDTPLVDLVISAHEEMAALLKQADEEQDGNLLAEIYQRLADLDAFAAPAKAATLLRGLGFSDADLSRPFSDFSGGWRMRVALASVLFLEPEILLLDEPTNHLDIEAIIWLEQYLASYPHSLLVISHDRDLLNKCIDHVLHVDNKKLTLYTGNYDAFENERALRMGLQQKMFEKQQAQIAHMKSYVDRFRAQASKARQAQSRLKAIGRISLVDEVIRSRAIQFHFPNPDKVGTPMITIDHADIGYEEGKPILRRVHQSIDTDDRIALLGANGNGKSTLIKLIANKLDAMNGEVFRTSRLRIGYFSQHQTEELNLDSTPYLEMMKLMSQHIPDVREPAVRAKLGAFGFMKELADNKIGALSGGEKARLLFALMTFDAPHLLLLDEPTNHLDIEAREALVGALNSYEGAIILVSHDPSIVERVVDRLWLVADGTCQNFDGDLQDYRKFVVNARRESRKQEKQKNQKLKEQESLSVSNTDNTESTTPAQQSASEKPKGNPIVMRKKAQEAEKLIAKLTDKKKSLEDAMASPDFFKDKSNAIKGQKDYDQVLIDLAKQEEIWIENQLD
jgi:ATP-binding cassette subfamily F protein 3